MKYIRTAHGVFIGMAMICMVIYAVIREPNCFSAPTPYKEILARLQRSKIYAYGPYVPLSCSKNLVTILIRSISEEFIGRVQQFDLNFQDNFTTSLLIMHDHRTPRRDLLRLAGRLRRQVLFLNVDDAFALYPDTFDPCWTRSTWRTQGKWNYHLMIRFWFKVFFELPQLQSYEYVLRLDDDSKLTGKWTNIFDEMRAKRAVYFANTVDQDFEGTVRGTMKLKPVVMDYIQQNNITAKQSAMFNDAFHQDMVRTYFNNFEVTRLDFFRRADVRHWIDAIDATHGIFRYRWGDAILRYLTIALFAERQEVLHRLEYGLPYCHKC